jgi:N utilization substance protein B
MLFAVEVGGDAVERVQKDYWRQFPGDAEGRPFADALAAEVAAHRDALDVRITAASRNWRLERMNRVDRNVLRLATLELWRHPEVPPAVVLDEAVDLAKRYGTEDSGAFVNGVLARVAADLGVTVEPSPGAARAEDD